MRADDVAGWLRADAGAAVRFEPVARSRSRSRSRGAPAPAADLRDGLRRWRRRVARRRALVTARRLLLVGAALALATGVALMLAGADHRSPWLVAPAALAALAGAILATRRVTLEETAHMLDRGLGLHDRVGTALELAGAPRRTAGAAGLERRIAAEADAALAQSFRGARLTAPSARAERLALLATALGLTLLIALPSAHGHRNRAPSAAAGVGAGRRAAAPYRAGTRRRGSARLAAPSADASRPSGAAPRRRADAASRSVPRVAIQQLQRNGIAAPRRAVSGRRRRHGGPQGVSVAVRARGRGSSHRALAGVFEALPTGSGAGSAGVAVGVEVPGGAVGLSPAASAVRRAGGGRRHAPAAPRGGGARNGGPTGSPHGGGSPGGDRPGAQPGRTALGPALVPNLAHGTAGLPLAAGYAPSLTGQAARPSGVSQIPNGGAGSGRSARAGGAGGGSTNFAVLAPFSDPAPSVDEPQLNDYFGVTNQLGPGSW